ncbi:MAG: ankyrin repeat domain-containing protein [Desulfomonilaceae bacterium]
MNKKVAFIITASILVLVAQNHRAYAADTSAELFAAVKSGETAKVGQLLAAGADPNARRQVGLTPLISSALDGRADIAKLLLDKGANVNAKSDNGMTALMVAASKGHKAVAQLLLDNGADANIRNDTLALNAFQMAVAAKHSEVAALLRPHTVGAPNAVSALLATKRHFVITVLYPCLFGIMALFFLVIGLRGIVTKKPFLISARWLLVLVLLGFTPGMLQTVTLPTTGDGPGSLMAIRLMLPAVLIVVLVFLSFTLRGYIAFGVTDASFREGLLASLKKLNLDCEETMSILRLPTIGADLQVAVQSWIGTAQIKMKQRQFRKVLGDIASNMNEYYQNSAVSKMNLTSCIFYAVMGVFLIVFAGVFLFGFSKIL